MAFLTEDEPPRLTALPVLPGITRVVAPNPSVMTYHGTNTYLIDHTDGITVLDPGPSLPAHIGAVAQAGAGRIRRILLTHTHSDHAGAAAALRDITGAPVHGWRHPANPAFAPDHPLDDGDVVAGLTAVHTPGHASDHLCFTWTDGTLFTGDHVMGWSSSIVNPPDGNMAAYMASLQLLLDRSDRRYLCGHGPPIDLPHDYVKSLLHHRVRRESAIAKAVAHAPSDTYTLMDRLYSKIDPWLRAAAERNVLAHLQKLQSEGHAEQHGDVWQWTAAASPQTPTGAEPQTS